MKELLIAIQEATNVRSIEFDKKTQHWTINYFGFVEPDFIDSDNLIDFLISG